ncbi:MAG: 3-deoxy-7-phosphoheptulonate synthase [Candidatus Gastranaerophilales bacterium]|nr:3-deoxy-7-phosphoheptulonate synthase [Candidatus Gastranaerophilales bacterium]
MNNNWSPLSWRTKTALQQPEYKDKDALNKTISELKLLPPLVFEKEIEDLKFKLRLAEKGKMFIIQGGDCVERFADCNEKTILNKMKILLQMSMIITYTAKIPVIKIGRIAGEYSKPRSNEFETVNGIDLPSYRGDSINSYRHDPSKREAQPDRIIRGYFHAAATCNYIRSITRGGFADLRTPSNWNIEFARETVTSGEYRTLIANVINSIEFLECFDGVNNEIINCTDFYISHEGLLLPYEEAMTRKSLRQNEFYNLGAHMLWIGERTRDINNAHVEYFRGINNPVGIKISSEITPDELIRLLNILNPQNNSGKICLITRMGCKNVKKYLPDLIHRVKKENKNVVWICDPMHGNTTLTKQGIKTRDFKDILQELTDTFLVHKTNDSFMSGVHFELTGERVTECIGGAINIAEENLEEHYETYCDPRLNYDQSMEISFLLAKFLKNA